jgi:3-oxoacyl-[acyl-carrier protein] reductase
MNTLTDKVILITGAGKGRGRLLAHRLAEYGAIIAANDIAPINVEQVVEAIHQTGGRAKAYVEDVAKKVGVQNLINSVEADFKRIDVLIYHAAVRPWHRVLDVNLTGAFLATQSAGRLMRQQGGGVILLIVTETGRDERNEAAFQASMQGLEMFAQQASRELSPYGLQVHAVQDTAETIVQTVLKSLEVV